MGSWPGGRPRVAERLPDSSWAPARHGHEPLTSTLGSLSPSSSRAAGCHPAAVAHALALCASMPRPPGSHLNATPELAGRSRPAHRIHGAPFGSRASTRNRAPVGAATASGLPALVCLLCWPFAFRCLDWIGRSSGCCTVQRGYRSESSFFIREGRVRTDHTFVALPLYCHRYRLCTTVPHWAAGRQY